ncbi:MAK10-like protein [Tanacetum coccineum]|uniref:MAK10-like protein n=1 Tax=Tanacetum coccineum TaxID=301880 RepID=A0ABQ5H0I1_9ASTR
MGDTNIIRTLGDYSKPSNEGYRNTIELPVGENMVPLRFDTIRLVQNGCSFNGLRSEDPNQHLKDFLKLVDSLDLDSENRERTRLRSITTWEDLTTRFLAQFFPPGRTIKLRNDILMFQQHQGESLSEAWTRFKDLLPKVPHHGIDLWLQVQIFYDHVTPATRRTIDQSAGGKLHDKNAKESWALLEDLALYENESWNVPRDFAKPVKAISLPQDVPSTSDRHLIEIENQVQCLVEAHLAPSNLLNQSNLEGLVSNFVASQDARLSKFEADFKQQQIEMTNKIETVLKAIADRIVGALPSNTVKNPKLNTSPVLSVRSYPIIDPQCSSHPSTSINVVKTCSKEASHFQTSLLQTRMGIRTKQVEEPISTLEDEFQDLHLNLPVLEVLARTDHIFGLADGTKSYSVGIVKDVEVRIGKLKLLNDFYVIDMKKDPETPLLVGRGFLATANAVIDCRKAKIAIREGITMSVFRVKGVNLGEEEAPYWTTLRKRESYKPRPSSDGIGAQTPYYVRKDFLDCHLPGEWEIARDAKINRFKYVLVFRRMVKFLKALPINLKRNTWELEDLIKNPIN